MLEIIKINKNDVIVFESEHPLTAKELEKLNDRMGELGVKAIILDPSVKMRILKAEERGDGDD